MEIDKPKRKRQVNPDRITLSKASLENLMKLETQIDKAFGGMVKLKNKDLTNFLVEARTSDLTNAELKLIKERYFDEVRAAQWALHKLKEAKERGEELKLSAILAQLQTPFVKEKQPRKMTDKKKSVSEHGPAQSQVTDANGGHSGAFNALAKAKSNGPTN
jgi:hypothetical protein